MEQRRFAFVWTGLDAPRTEYAEVKLSDDGLVATGVQIGVEPGPYAVEYELRTDAQLVAAWFQARSRTVAGERRLLLVRGDDGRWHGESHGESPRDLTDLAGALDVDLGFSPLFNSTPVLRDRLHQGGAATHEYVMAWVSVPDLTVTASRQRYEPLGADRGLSAIRYTSLDSGFTARIWFDRDGFVVEYEDFLKRITAERDAGT
jgi:hypothetical protein